MGAPAKFLFDVDFSAPDKARERAATPAEIAARVAQAEALAYRSGFEAGQRESHAESERRTAASFQEIGAAIALSPPGSPRSKADCKPKRSTSRSQPPASSAAP